MRTHHHVPRGALIPLWGPNDYKDLQLGRPRGHLKGIRAIARYKRWKKLADRLRFLPREGGE